MYQSNFIRPFGPTIYQGKLTAKQIDYLQEVADATYEARQNVGNDLAGNIRDQLGIVVDDQEPFMNIIQPHLRKFIQYEDKRANSLLINKEPEKSQESYDNLNFNLGTGPWINYQIANEFNPVCHEPVPTAKLLWQRFLSKCGMKSSRCCHNYKNPTKKLPL